jgi:hypothetical protein
MTKIDQQSTDIANRQSTKSLPERAREAEDEWRAKLGLSKGLHRKGNAMARERRRRSECPKEPKAALRYRRYRKKQLGKLGSASTVRRIDPGE